MLGSYCLIPPSSRSQQISKLYLARWQSVPFYKAKELSESRASHARTRLLSILSALQENCSHSSSWNGHKNALGYMFLGNKSRLCANKCTLEGGKRLNYIVSVLCTVINGRDGPSLYSLPDLA